jgi:hypothetical protein
MRIARRILVAFLLPLASCIRPLVNPEPVSASTTLSIPDAVQRITAAVVIDGFEIVLSDPVTGTLVAKRERGPKGNSDFLRCAFAKGSIAETHGVTSLVVSISIRNLNGVNSVLVNTKTTTIYPTLMNSLLAKPPSEVDCVTNGKAEDGIRQAISSASASGRSYVP